MDVGLYAINYGACADPETLVRVAQHAEQAGLKALWAGEHLVLPKPQGDYAIAPDIPFLDALIALTLAAAHTSTIRLGTAIIELPLHQPVLLAKQLASVDVISGGRLTVGVGVGYLQREFDALGVSLDGRGARTDEYLAAMRSLWIDDAPEFHGEYVSFAEVDAHPRPLQAGGVPVMIGGNSGLARRRAVTAARGWFPADLDVDDVRAARAALDRDLAELDRPAALGPFDFSVITPRNRLDHATVDAYREAGVDHLVMLPGLDVPRAQRYESQPVDDILRTIDHLAAFIEP